MKKNVAGQVIGAHLISKTDGSDVTTGTTTVYVTGDNGTQASGSGTVTHKGNGFWTYAPTQAETNYNHVAFTFVNSAAVSVTVQVYTNYPQSGDSYPTINTNLDARVSDVKAKTDQLTFTVTNKVDANVTHVAGTSQTARDLGAQLDVAVSSRASATDYTSARAAKLDNLDATISSRASASTALSNTVWTDTKAGYIDVAISSRAPESGGNIAAIKAKTDQLSFTVANRVDANALQVGDKTGYSLSSSGIDAIWDATGSLGLSFETLMQRAYEMINNKMTVNESTGAVTLLSLGGGSTIATGSVTSSSGTTTRNELSWV
uniref:Uncharacterized protein n=1 Tax=Caldisericum exile TaxID=693075 RepID=A0A7C4U1X6_9BACT